jgi:Ca2+-binding RTX toxin-like protein
MSTSTHRKLQIESLETRQMMAANVTASLYGGTLTINGTNRDDFIVVRQFNNRISVDNVRIAGSGYIHKIVVSGFDGNDVVRLDANGTPGQAVRVPCLVFGGNGNDFIVGGNANDELQGNAGNDTLYGLNGHDRLFGQDGHDLVFGGAGNDQLVGGAGNDELLGEIGHDQLWGQDGYDWLEGGDGDDHIDGGAWYDVAFGGRGSDRFVNLNDRVNFWFHPHLRSPIRGVGNAANYGIQDWNA